MPGAGSLRSAASPPSLGRLYFPYHNQAFGTMRFARKKTFVLAFVVGCVGLGACQEQAPSADSVEATADVEELAEAEDPAEAAGNGLIDPDSLEAGALGSAVPPAGSVRPPPTRPDEAGSPAAPQSPPPASSGYPQFPWPPPRPSASVEIPRSLLRPSVGAPETLGAVDRRLSDALRDAGYTERSYFAVPGGFALLTQIEQIGADGSARDPRWLANGAPQRWTSVFSLQPLLRVIGLAPPGYYRVIVFVVTPRTFSRAGDRLDAGEMRALFDTGLNRLPPALAQRPYTDDVATTALVYEFERGPRQQAHLNVPGLLTGREHLERSGLLGALAP